MKPNLSAAKSAPLRAPQTRLPRQRAKAILPDSKKIAYTGLGSEIHAAFRSSGVEFQIVTPPRRGKNRARPIPFVKVQ